LILRTLYFGPDGILSLLKEVAEGNRPTDERIRQALIDFNDQQWKIEGAIEGLEFGTLEKELGINLNSIMVLTSLREGKIDLRWAIQEEVKSYGQPEKSPNRTNVRKLISAIENLNAAIEQVEAVINRRAPPGPLQKGVSLKSARKTTLRKKATVSKAPNKRVKKAKAE
jgi:hypothetical protein